MKIFSVLTCALLALNAYSQENYCGTQMSQEMMDWLDNYKSRRGSQAFKNAANSSIKYIPVKVHIVGDNEGKGYLKFQHFLDGFCNLNEQFKQVGFHFYIYGDINFINNSTLYNHDDGTRQLLGTHMDPVAANIFYMGSADGNCGYYSPWGDYVVVANSCAGPTNTTVAHEFGHFFNLPHTFSGWENRDYATEPARSTDERVNGSNCHTAGDRFCDTPADYISDRWQCPYRDTKTDYNNEPYQVDPSLYMSYARDACQDRFSPEQIDAMHAQVEDERTAYLSLPPPDVDTVGKVEAIYPPHNTADIPANFAQLKWKKIPGVAYYHLQMTRLPTATVFQVDTVLSDTSIIITDLDFPYEYKWRVRPISPGNTCSGYNALNSFFTKEQTPIVPDFVISNISCPGSTDGSISLGVSGGTQPYYFNWSTGASGQIINNLVPGTYFVTISESNSESLVISFDIAAPQAISTDIVQSGSMLNAVVTGGTPPFTYAWSNGSTLPENPVSAAGDYSLTITDSRGCSVTKSFFFTSISYLNALDTRVFPNPMETGQMLTLEISANQSFRGTVELLDNTGKKIVSLDRFFVAGMNRETLHLPSLSKGIYVLRITGNGVNFNRKVAVM